LFIEHSQLEDLVSDHRVVAIKFVGSTPAGKKIAELAGRYMKMGAFELGGSDPFIVLEDADIEMAALKAINGRLRNNG